MKSNIPKLPLSPQRRFDDATKLVKDHADLALAEANKLIDENYWHAYSLAGLIYEGKCDFKAALFSYERGTETVGALESWLGMARIYLSGVGVPQDYDEALRCYRIICEGTDHMLGWLMLGIMHRRGLGVKADLVKARSFLQKAVDKGSIAACTEMAEIDAEEGRRIRGIIRRINCGLNAAKVAFRDASDIRLRNDYRVVVMNQQGQADQKR